MACTTLLVGRRATNDGSTIVARNEDGEDFSFDPKKHDRGACRKTSRAPTPAWPAT